MKNIMIAGLILATLTALVAVSYLWKLQTADDPLAANKVELQKIRILKDIESLRLSQEREKQESAKLAAKLAKERAEQERQANIQAAPVVVKSRVTLTAFLYFLPILLTASALIGIPCYAVFRHVAVETPFYKGNLPVKKAVAIAERSLNVSNAAELAKAMAFAEELSQNRLKTDADVLKSLRAGRESVTIQQALPAATEQIAPMTPHVPTFDELLRAGKFEPGKPMVFGFKEQGDPKTGTWKDAYSLGIAGESGSGKSTTIRCVIAQSFLTQAVGKAFFLDPHYPHPESLLASMGDLIHAPQVRYAENRIETLDLIQEIHDHIDRRLAGQEPSEPLMIVVVDELPVLVKKFPKIAELMEKIGMESRKAGVYGIFAAQSWNGDKVGGTTARDNLTALMVHAMKRKQANTLLQDNELAKQVDKLQRGQVLFSPTQGKPEILTVPYCAIEDMPEVVRRLANGGTVTNWNKNAHCNNISQGRGNGVSKVIPFTRRENVNTHHAQTTASTPATTVLTPNNSVDDIPANPSDFIEKVRGMMEARAWTLGELSRKSGVDKGQLSKIINLKIPLTATVYQALTPLLLGKQQEA